MKFCVIASEKKSKEYEKYILTLSVFNDFTDSSGHISNLKNIGNCHFKNDLK